jgi:hypothetical protein
MTLGHEFTCISGLAQASCHWLANRFDEEAGFRPDQGESWVGFTTGTRLTSSFVQRGWMTALWQTCSQVWVSESAGRVFMNPKLGLSAPWKTFQLEGMLRGIWGLEDDFVLTWGEHRGEPVAYRWNGSDWRQVATPGHIVGVHGVSRDLVYAVGQRGLIARWNGADKFDAVTSPAKGTLADVHVVSEDELYACGPDAELLQGTVRGWELLLEHERPLHCVAKWRDAVWIGAADGLYQRVDQGLVSIKDNISVRRFDARGELLMTIPHLLARTQDGVKFEGIPVKSFANLSRPKPPSWK